MHSNATANTIHNLALNWIGSYIPSMDSSRTLATTTTGLTTTTTGLAATATTGLTMSVFAMHGNCWILLVITYD